VLDDVAEQGPTLQILVVLDDKSVDANDSQAFKAPDVELTPRKSD
jgi:hypothetical protein